MTRRPTTWGFSLVLTLFVVAAVLLAGFTLAALATFNYQMATQRAEDAAAFDAANAGLSDAIYRLTVNQNWGTAGTEILSASLTPDSHYTLSFAAGTGVPCSVNCLASFNPGTSPEGRAVPPCSALLFVKGTAGSGLSLRTHTLEALVQFPPYAFALSATGSIDSASTGQGSSGIKVTVSGTKGPGNVLALGDLILAADSTISGNAVVGGNTNVIAAPNGRDPRMSAPSAHNVDDASGDTIPDIQVSTFDNSATAPHLDLTQSYTTLTGPAYAGGSLQLGLPPPAGATGSASGTRAVLTNVSLFVNGDLTVPWGLDGTGSIYVTGAVHLTCAPATNFSAGPHSGIAIFSQGDIELGSVAQGKANLNGNNNLSIFSGTLYTHGCVHLLTGLQVNGSVVACADSSPPCPSSTLTPGTIQLDDWGIFYYDPQYTQYGTTISKTQNMQGYLLTSPQQTQTPLLKVTYWRELP